MCLECNQLTVQHICMHMHTCVVQYWSLLNYEWHHVSITDYLEFPSCACLQDIEIWTPVNYFCAGVPLTLSVSYNVAMCVLVGLSDASVLLFCSDLKYSCRCYILSDSISWGVQFICCWTGLPANLQLYTEPQPSSWHHFLYHGSDDSYPNTYTTVSMILVVCRPGCHA